MIIPRKVPIIKMAVSPINAIQLTSLTPFVVVFPFTVATIPKIAISAFVRKSNSNRSSFSGSSHLKNSVPTGISIKTALAKLQAMNEKDDPGKEKIRATSMQNKIGNMSIPGNHLKNLYMLKRRFVTG